MTFHPSPLPLASSGHSGSLEVPAERLHDDWREDWGKTITSARNREAIAANPRLSGRISRDIIASIQGGEINTSEISPSDLLGYQVTIDQPERMKLLLGLADHAHLLFDMVAGPQVRMLTQKVDVSDLKLALSCRDFVPATMLTRLAPEKLSDAIESAGTRMMMEWSQTLPRAFSTRIKLLYPKKSLFEAARSPSANHSLSRLVYHLASELTRNG